MCSNRGMGQLALRVTTVPTVCDCSRPDGIPAAFTGSAAACLVVLAILVSGCGGPAADGGSAPGSSATTAITVAQQPAPPVELRLVDYNGLMKEVASHLGKVVVLDCWSTSCPPCVREFPGLVALAERHGDRVACLSLAFDYDGIGSPEDLVEPVRAFLETMGAGRVTNLLSREEAYSLYRKLDLTSVPAVFLWKPDGERAIRYDDEMAARDFGRAFTYDDVEKTVAALLAE